MSSFLDLNNIYGDNLIELARLRSFSGGQFQMDPNYHLPINDAGVFIAGDFQFVQNTGLMTQHVVLYRFHNWIAKSLAEYYRNWDDDKLFFEARRIMIAVYQHIIYDEWLPLVLGAHISFIFICAIWNRFLILFSLFY